MDEILNNRILALIALIFFISGCTQVATLTSSSPAPQTPDGDIEAAPTSTTEITEISDAPVIEPELVITVDENPTDNSLTFQDSEPALTEVVASSTAVSDRDSARAQVEQSSVRAMCREIGNKLGSVSIEDCLAQPLTFADAYTVQSRPMVVRDFLPERREGQEGNDKPRILILGGIHGDEYSSISIMFKWMALLDESGKKNFQWRFAPTVNPDGLLDGQAVRQNANGVDLNRNFPSDDWLDLAVDYWANTTNRNPRRYPGTHPASEPEVQWVVEQINSYKPDVIVSVHAPYHLLDYDGPPEPPQRIGELHLHLLGVYPGSLGNYAGINLGIPVVTMELPSAGIMPSDEQILTMWEDLQNWLAEHLDS